MSRLTLALVCTLALGCAGSDDDGGGGGTSGPGSSDGCGDGLRRGPDGVCEPLVFDGECPAGTRPALGFAECQPVGWQACPEGFERDASGWGCAPVLPAAACSGATREALGQTSCVALGDCGAFPPAGATLFVSKTAPLDATHFRRISDAIAAAGPGAVIAVDEGVYAESITLLRNVTIAGRCAERVRLDGGGTAAVPAVVAGASDATVRGVTIVGWDTGVSVERGKTTFEDVLFDHNSDVGVAVYDGATAALVRSVIRDTYPRASISGFGAQAIFGAKLELVESVVSKSQGGGVLAGEPGTSVRVERSIFRDNESDLQGGFGLGVNVTMSATADVRRSAFLENRRAGLRAGPKTKLTVGDTVVRGTRADASGGVGPALFALDEAEVTIARFAASGGEGPALTALTGAKVRATQATLRGQKGDKDGDLANGAYVFDAATMELEDTAIVDSGRAGADAFGDGTELTMARCLVASTRPSYGNKMGVGVSAAMGAHASVTDSSIVENRHSGIYLWEGGSIDLAGTLVRGTQKEIFEDRLGHGILVQDAPGVTIDRSVFDGNVGIGVALAGSPAVIRGSFIVRNAVGIHVQDATLRETDGATTPAAGEVLVTSDTAFSGNATKVGSGVLPLPDPPTTAKKP